MFTSYALMAAFTGPTRWTRSCRADVPFWLCF